MGIKRNFVYNSIITLSSYIMGLIVFPYISRVLGVENVGVVGFVDNTVSYFLLFSTLGIGVIGAREIATCGEDRAKRSDVFSNLISLSACLSIVVLIVYFIAIFAVPKFYAYKNLFFIGSAKLMFSVFLVEWLYSGTENFKYIAIRTIIIKIAYVICVFLFVRRSSDYGVYFALTTTVIVVNAVINITHSRHFITFRRNAVRLTKYLKQTVWLGGSTIFTAMYTTFNIMYLGLVSTSTEVGFYWTSIKVYSIVFGFFTAFMGVMMPRMSALFSQNDGEAVKQMISKSFLMVFTVSFPIAIIGVIMASQIIRILSGSGYEGSILPMQIIMPLIPIVGISQIVDVQMLVPMRKDKIILGAAVGGAVVGLSANLLWVGLFRLGAVGTALVLACSEISIFMLFVSYAVRKKILDFPIKTMMQYALWSIPYALLCIGALRLPIESVFATFAIATVSCVVYFLFLNLVIIKNQTVVSLLKGIFTKIDRR